MASPTRRIVAVVLSQLLYELAREQRQLSARQGAHPISKGTPVAVVLAEGVSKETALTEGAPKTAHENAISKLGDAARAPFSEHALENAEHSANEDAEPCERGIEPSSLISAVNDAAHGYGVRAGQTVAEARAWVAHLQVLSVSSQAVRQALQRVAESLLSFSPTVSIGYPDTIWLDITGTAHLFDGEPALLRELTSRLSNLGHFCRLAIARGPVLARAFAQWMGRGRSDVIIDDDMTKERASELPIVALPVSGEVHAWLAQLGLLQFSDLAGLPRSQLASRLGSDAGIVLDLIEGHDTRPLEAFVPAELPSEAMTWDEPVAGQEPLLFALRGLTSKLSARLEGRGLAAQALHIVIEHDRTIARFRQLETEVTLPCRLASPLFRYDDLWRIIVSKIGRTELAAPSVGVRLEVKALAVAPERQLDLMSSTSRLDPTNPERLQLLLNELATELGPDQFGTLSIENSHRPEKISQLKPIEVAVGPHRKSRPPTGTRLGHLPTSFDRATAPKAGKRTSKKAKRPQQISFESATVSRPNTRPHASTTSRAPTQATSEASLPWQANDRAVPNRLLQEPIMLTGPIEAGSFLAFGGQLYSICEVAFEYRLDSVEWWSGQNISRDYMRVRLSASGGQLDALIYKNRITGRAFLQALYD